MDNPTTYDSYRYVHAKSSWMSALEAFRLVEEAASLGAKSGNIDAYLQGLDYDENQRRLGDIPDGTSDFRATVPVLYLLTNGIDLMLKAFLYAGHPDRQPRTVPKTPELVAAFAAEFSELTSLQAFVVTYTDSGLLPGLFAEFLAANEMDIAAFLSQRRHLSNTSFFTILERYRSFPYRWEDGRVFYAQLAEKLKQVIPLLQELQTDIDSDGNPGVKVLALKRENAAARRA
ncbi:MAG: hypothetical protein LBO07_07430 [Coriobacteriales bacterium]|jgi:hypothetical protein|nr:hypothetical protein [Coriobacteriales bacterium]